jgi:cephalosporin hydroxylase
MRERLATLARIPKMSSMAIAALINEGVRQLRDDQAFVNIGVWHGYTLLAAMAGNPDRRCIGVDNFSTPPRGLNAIFRERFERHRGPRHELHEMGCEEYFARAHQGTIGFCLYDGNHAYEHQLAGLRVAEPMFGDDCLVLVDDTNTDQERHGTLDFLAHSANRYRILLDVATDCSRHPTFWNGIMLLQRQPS